MLEIMRVYKQVRLLPASCVPDAGGWGVPFWVHSTAHENLLQEAEIGRRGGSKDRRRIQPTGHDT